MSSRNGMWGHRAELLHQVVEEIDMVVGIGGSEGVAAGNAGKVSRRVGNGRGRNGRGIDVFQLNILPRQTLRIGDVSRGTTIVVVSRSRTASPGACCFASVARQGNWILGKDVRKGTCHKCTQIEWRTGVDFKKYAPVQSTAFTLSWQQRK